jgi:hypothetical protein
MRLVHGKVVNGAITVDEDVALEEGEEALVLLRDDEPHEMTPEQEAELEAALDEADRGEGIPAEQVLRELRELREQLTR